MNKIKMIKKVDVLVLGSTSSAAMAAISAKNEGASVYLVSPLNYLGEDICAYLQYDLAEGEIASNEFEKELFKENRTPNSVKRLLEQSVLNSGAEILMGSYPVGGLEDADGNICGAVIANKSGRQGILAKRIIDASENGLFARLSSVKFNQFSGGNVQTKFRVLAPEALHENAVIIDDEFKVYDEENEAQTQTIFEYVSTEFLKSMSVKDCASLQKILAQRYWQYNASLYNEKALIVPQERIQTDYKEIHWNGAENIADSAIRCANNTILILGPAANVSDEIAEKLMRPIHGIKQGSVIGKLIAEECLNLSISTPVRIKAFGEEVESSADVMIYHSPFEANTEEENLNISHESFPKLGSWDTIVVGGGTAGASAAIASARQGIKTLVLEFQHALGGVGTIGQISVYYHGNHVGFSNEINDGVNVMGPGSVYDNKMRWTPTWKQAWYQNQVMEEHVDIWYKAVAYGVLVKDSKVLGVLVATPYGHGLVEAKSIIDSTGSADIAAAAGAPCKTIQENHIAVQGTGLSPVSPFKDYNNTDHNFIDDNNQKDVTAAMISAKVKFSKDFDVSQLVNSRERRQIYGEYELGPSDFFCNHHFNDSICFAKSNFDSHGFVIHPIFTLKAPDKTPMRVYVPLRSLLPQGIDNVLVTGLGVSAHRDVLPVIRMQCDVQNQGYAAGFAAALVAKEGGHFKSIDIRKVQKHLVEIGNLPEEVLTHENALSIPEEVIKKAVTSEYTEYHGLAVMFANQERSLPYLKEAWNHTDDACQKLEYAKIMGMMGDDTGAESLIRTLENETWDEGWNYKGMGHFGMSVSPYDAVLIAIGRCVAKGAIPFLVKRISELDEDCYFSHARALSIACEGLGKIDEDGELKNAVYQLLKNPKLLGYDQQTMEDVHNALTDNPVETEVRNNSLKEIVLARALYYCGDSNGLAEKILLNYSHDIRGIFARHATGLLKS